MSVLNEPIHAGAFLVSEANGTYSRAVGTLMAGCCYLAGAVLGRVTATGLYTNFDPVANDGSQKPVAILFGAIDATDEGIAATLIKRAAEINSEYLSWKEGITDAQKVTALTALEALGMVDRYGGHSLTTVGALVLSFADYPAGGVAGADLGPVVVRIENDDGDLVEGDCATPVTLAIKAGEGDLIGGGVAVAVNGVVTWPQVQISAAGSFVLVATADGRADAISGAIAIG